MKGVWLIQNDSELLAKRIVEAVLPNATMEYRECQHGDGSLRHDFWLHRPNASKVALEVTSVRDEDRIRTQKKLKESHFTVPTDKCEWTWRVKVAPKTNFQELRQSLDACLADLESQGVEHLPSHSSLLEPSPRSPLLADLLVVSASALPAVQPPTIYVHVQRSGTWVNPGVVNEALRGPVAENAEKLAETGAPERHLFVLLDSEESSGTVLPFASPEGVEPHLPEEITHVWVAAPDFRLKHRLRYVVWRAAQGGSWTSLGPIAIDAW